MVTTKDNFSTISALDSQSPGSKESFSQPLAKASVKIGSEFSSN
jgi:hypothetical protein